MFRFIKKVFVLAMSFFSCNALKCVSMNNQECKVSTKIISISSNEPSFHPYSVKVSKRRGSSIISLIHMQNYVLLMLVKT